MPSLFDPVQVGSITAKNRIFLAPMTRARATKEGIPTGLMLKYYEQRSTAGVIVTEGVGISRVGLGWPYAPGIYTKEQIEGWKPITKGVHDKGGKIVLQLWHMGRAAHSAVTGSAPVSCSPTSYPTQIHTYDDKKDAEVAHELTKEEIKETVQDFATAAKNAIEAGFDGVQIHGANGYLIDQFLRDGSNLRTDEYGGSPDNRLRFMKEVVEAVIEAVGADKTSIRLSPNGESQGVIDSDPAKVFIPAAKWLGEKGIASLAIREGATTQGFTSPDAGQPRLNKEIREAFKGTLILNSAYDRERAISDVENGVCDAVSFGRYYIYHPDLPEMIKQNKPFETNIDLMKVFYSQGAEGYTDFPTST